MCATLTFTCSHRVTMSRLPSDEVDTLIAKTPDTGLRKRKNVEPAINEYLPESLANNFRTNGAQSWPEVEKVLKSL
jgi:hypothetical protein